MLSSQMSVGLTEDAAGPMLTATASKTQRAVSRMYNLEVKRRKYRQPTSMMKKNYDCT